MFKSRTVLLARSPPIVSLLSLKKSSFFMKQNKKFANFFKLLMSYEKVTELFKKLEF